MPKKEIKEKVYDENSELDLSGEEDDEESFDLDDLLPAIGEFGKYQKLLVFGICLPACIPCGFCAFNQLFMSDMPEDYWCKVPELQELELEQRKFLSIPITEDDGIEAYSKCYKYAVNWTDILENTDINTLKPNKSWNIEKCGEDKWEYNKSTVWSSIVIDVYAINYFVNVIYVYKFANNNHR